MLPNDCLVSTGARERWLRWRSDLGRASIREGTEVESDMDISDTNEMESGMTVLRRTAAKQSDLLGPRRSLTLSAASTPRKTPASDRNEYFSASPAFTPNMGYPTPEKYRGSSGDSPNPTSLFGSPLFHGHDGHAYANSEDGSAYDCESFVDDGPQWKKPRLLDYSHRDSLRGSDISATTTSTIYRPTAVPSLASSPPQDVSPQPGLSERSDMLPPTLRPMNIDHEDARPLLPYIHGSSTDQMKGHEDLIIDTVGAIAVDCYGNIASGSSSGGIGMKYRGRTGPAALVGVGSAVIPIDPSDRRKECVAVVTSGTGEHMATTQAASVCASRLMLNSRARKLYETEEYSEDNAIRDFIKLDFMGTLRFIKLPYRTWLF